VLSRPPDNYPVMARLKYYSTNDEKTHEIGDSDVPSGPKRVLIVEDEAEFAMMIKEFLESQGNFLVTFASDGVVAIKQVMAGDFDVILCDMVMPNLAGDMFYLAVERVRPHLCKRFIFMTGHKGDAKIAAFIRKVRGLVLWKPFEMYMLMEAINAVEKKIASDSAQNGDSIGGTAGITG